MVGPTSLLIIVALSGAAIIVGLTWYELSCLRAMKFVIASSYAPVDVQIMRIVDLTRELLQWMKRELEEQPEPIATELLESWRGVRDLSRRVALQPGDQAVANAYEEQLNRFDHCLRSAYVVLEMRLEAQDWDEWTRRVELARQRLHGSLPPFVQAVERYNRRLTRSPLGFAGRIGFTAACALETTLAEPFIDSE